MKLQAFLSLSPLVRCVNAFTTVRCQNSSALYYRPICFSYCVLPIVQLPLLSSLGSGVTSQAQCLLPIVVDYAYGLVYARLPFLRENGSAFLFS